MSKSLNTLAIVVAGGGRGRAPRVAVTDGASAGVLEGAVALVPAADGRQVGPEPALEPMARAAGPVAGHRSNRAASDIRARESKRWPRVPSPRCSPGGRWRDPAHPPCRTTPSYTASETTTTRSA